MLTIGCDNKWWKLHDRYVRCQQLASGKKRMCGWNCQNRQYVVTNVTLPVYATPLSTAALSHSKKDGTCIPRFTSKSTPAFPISIWRPLARNSVAVKRINNRKRYFSTWSCFSHLTYKQHIITYEQMDKRAKAWQNALFCFLSWQCNRLSQSIWWANNFFLLQKENELS